MEKASHCSGHIEDHVLSPFFDLVYANDGVHGSRIRLVWANSALSFFLGRIYEQGSMFIEQQARNLDKPIQISLGHTFGMQLIDFALVVKRNPEYIHEL